MVVKASGSEPTASHLIKWLRAAVLFIVGSVIADLVANLLFPTFRKGTFAVLVFLLALLPYHRPASSGFPADPAVFVANFAHSGQLWTTPYDGANASAWYRAHGLLRSSGALTYYRASSCS